MKPSSKNCKLEADQFLYIATRCTKDADTFLSTPYVFVVSCSFACELYMKAILMNNNVNPPKTHDLGKLFDALSPDDRTKIENTYNSKEEIKPIAELITECKTAFEDWRYAYEKESLQIHVDALQAFAESLKELLS